MGAPATTGSVELAPGHHARLEAGQVVVFAGDDRSRLAHALRHHLTARDERGVPAVVLGDWIRARFPPHGASEVDPLTAFEARFLADNGVPLPLPAEAPCWQPRTDLHTHFAGALSGAVLVELAAEHGAPVPRGVLAEAGVDAPGDVDASKLEALARERLARALDVPLDRQITFPDMERLYRRRQPFTKNGALLVPQLRAIARAFAREGVEYAELSLSSSVEPAVLEALHANLDAIEEEHGVRLRFLVALSRHDDPEWDLDILDRLEQCEESAAVAGVDFMGHETCSTRAFLPVLRRAAELGARRPGFVVRVHAGENPAFPENVREAVRALMPFSGVEIRVGHGLYGVDDETLEMMAKDERVVVEFNLTSNLALNNIQTTLQVPIRRYVSAGVRIVLGSDGAGLYGTSAAGEARAAIACGLDASHLRRAREVEDELLARRRTRELALPALRSWIAPEPRPARHFTPAREAAYGASRAATLRALHLRVEELGAVAGRDPPPLRGPLLWLAGAWRSSFLPWTPEEVTRATCVVDEVLGGLAARGGLLLTGGTHLGVEGIAHGLAAAHGLEVLGAIVGATQPEDLDARVRRYWLCAPTLYEKAQPVVELARDAGGLALFVGGGLIVADEQQAAHNLRVRHVVLSGLRGPAVDAARASRHARFVGSAAEILEALDDRRPAGRLRHAGPNDAADVVVIRRGALGDDEVLLIRRHDDSGAASGRFALPGGFVRPGEALLDAAVREVHEETGLCLDRAALVHVAVVEGGGRDPRDTAERWVRSHVFGARIEHDGFVAGGSDAAAALFVRVDRRPPLAFDHDALLERAHALLHAP